MKLTIKEMIHIAIGTALIAIGALIKIPSPVAGYFTLQLPAVIMIGIILLSKPAGFSVVLYIVGGLLGIPWFASGGGLGYVVSPTFGFLLAFVLAAWVSGLTPKKPSFVKRVILSELSVLLVWFIGMLYMTVYNQMYLGKEVSYVASILAIFSFDLVFDIILAFVATQAGLTIKRALGR